MQQVGRYTVVAELGRGSSGVVLRDLERLMKVDPTKARDPEDKALLDAARAGLPPR